MPCLHQRTHVSAQKFLRRSPIYQRIDYGLHSQVLSALIKSPHLIIIHSLVAKNQTSQIALRIEVNQHNLVASISKAPAKIKGGGGFTHTALVIKKTN